MMQLAASRVRARDFLDVRTYPYSFTTVSRNVQGSGLVTLSVRPDNDLNVLIESHQKVQQALHRKLAEVAA
jgi:hypothetical protein